jgi:hypothetical protein
VYHHAAECIIICPSANELDLATAAFFSWGSHGDDAAIDVVFLNCLCNANHSGQTSRGNKIVPTCVSDSIKCIIPAKLVSAQLSQVHTAETRLGNTLKIDYDRTTGLWSIRSFEGGVQAISFALDLEPTLFEEVGEDLVGVVFLVANFWVLMQLHPKD